MESKDSMLYFDAFSSAADRLWSRLTTVHSQRLSGAFPSCALELILTPRWTVIESYYGVTREMLVLDKLRTASALNT